MENEKQNLNNAVSENQIAKKQPSYGISLDMGTNSIGWAVVWDSGDKADQIVVRKGQRLYGARLFDAAEDSQKYRSARSARRTLGKKIWRLNLLKGVLKDYVLNEDKDFFKNLHLTQTHKGSNILFREPNYQDKEYFHEFKTIYHLRKALSNPEQIEQFKERGVYYRFLFLAAHDMLKNRGHFLIASDLDFSNTSNIGEQKTTLLNEIVEEILQFANANNEDEKVIPEKNEVIAEINTYFSNSDTKLKNNLASYIYRAIVGNVINYKVLFGDSDKQTGLTFKKNELNDLYTERDEVNRSIEKMFSYFSILQAKKILENAESISDFKIKLFKNHEQTVDLLKTLFKGTDVYKKIFKRGGIYEQFIGNGKGYKSGKKRPLKAYQDGFIKELNKILTEFFKNEEIKSAFLTEAESKGPEFKEFAEYLTSENPTFEDVKKGYTLYTPTNFEYSREVMNQLHLAELRKILDCSPLGADTKKNIETLLTFKADYFLGPLSQNVPGKNQWIVKKPGFENEKITPFNLDQVVDKIKTNKEFISRMQRNCSYLVDEKTMQQETILYQDYIFFNTVNKLCFGEGLTPITQEDKARLYQYLLDNNANQLTLKTIEKLLDNKKVSKGIDLNADKPTLPLSLSAQRKFRAIFSLENEVPADYLDSAKVAFFDEVINNFSYADKNNIEAKLEIIKELAHAYNIAEFKEIEINKDVKLTQELTKENFVSANVDVVALNKLMQVKSNKAGKLSRKFLADINLANKEGLWQPVISHLRESNLNLQELIYVVIEHKSVNLETIADENTKKELDLTGPNYLNQYLAERFVPPLSRRPIIQANKLIDEIIEIMNGQTPSHVTLEFTRTNDKRDKNKRTTSRREQIKKQIESLKNYEFKEKLIGELESNDKDPDLKSDKLYLYFSQLGKDMYTGKAIDIRNLEDYDIDHIFPQAKITDESIHNNKVLTSKDENRKKLDKYPLPLEIQSRESVRKHWNYLKENKLITQEKYIRLTRTTELKPEEVTEFENRQKNILDWVNKELINFLKDYKFKDIKDFEPVYSKSSYVDEFRKTFDFLKFRNLNKFHHAHDAYLNDVLAKIFKSRHKYYEDGNVEFKDKKPTTILERAIPKKTLMVNGKEVKFIDYFENIFNSDDQLMTKMTKIKNTGAFWDETIYGKNEGSVSVKRTFKEKIAHYNKPATAFFTIVELKTKDKKGQEKTSLKIVPVPIYHCSQFYDVKINQDGKVFNLAKFRKYISESFTTENTTAYIFSKIAEKPIIPVGTLCEVDGVNVRLTGKTNNECIYHNTCDFTIKQKDNYLYYRWLDKQFEDIFKEKEKNDEKIKNDKNSELVDIFKKYSYLPKNDSKKAIILSKENNLKLMEEIYTTIQKMFKEKKITSTVQQRFLINNNFDSFVYLSKFSELDFFKQVELLIAFIRVLLKSNVSNQGKILDLGRDIEKKKNKDDARTAIIDFKKNVEIQYSFCIIKESTTGFKTKKTTVFKK